MSKRAIVAVSGGVDSTVAALLLQREGYDVTGVHFDLFPGALDSGSADEAAAVCKKLGADFTVLERHARFRETVISYFIREYAAGRTPNPCVFCNRALKFSLLLETLRELDADVMATGHYAAVVRDPESGRFLLKRGTWPHKEQSYFLFRLSQEQLVRIRFPVGNYTKEQVRGLAADAGFRNAAREDSQEVCFIPGDYRDFLREHAPELFRPGKIVTTDGIIVGEHEGIALYTIGQRRGLGIAHPTPLYVLRLDRKENRVIVGDNDGLFASELVADQPNWVGIGSLEGPRDVSAQIRYRHEAADAVVEPVDQTAFRVRFKRPQRAITPGQAVVLYDGDVVLGGGIINKTL